MYLRTGVFIKFVLIFVYVFKEGCPPNDFECFTGECLASSFRCDGERQCHDGSDEENCGELVTVFFVYYTFFIVS